VLGSLEPSGGNTLYANSADYQVLLRILLQSFY
jgi:hypothetical protein